MNRSVLRESFSRGDRSVIFRVRSLESWQQPAIARIIAPIDHLFPACRRPQQSTVSYSVGVPVGSDNHDEEGLLSKCMRLTFFDHFRGLAASAQ